MTPPDYLAPTAVRDGGPHRFTRQVERLLGQLGFRNVTNIDGNLTQGSYHTEYQPYDVVC